LASVDLALHQNAPLALLTTLRVGGAASWFVGVKNTEEALSAFRWAAERQCPPFMLGGGSNVIVADSGWRGVVIRAELSGYAAAVADDHLRIEAGAGEVWDDVVARSVAVGFGGLECLSGIPGSVGGTPIQNVGAYGQEAGDVIDTVTAIDTATGALVRFTREECGFRYRHSRFKGVDAGRFFITTVAFRLQARQPVLAYPDLIAYLDRAGIREPSLADTRQAVLAVRRSKGMVLDPADSDTRSVGSFFMNPVVTTDTYDRLMSRAGGAAVPGFRVGDDAVKIPAGWLIEGCGFGKGYSAGAVGLSSKHPLAIVNRGGATASDVIDLAARIKRRVSDTFGIALRIEPVCVGFEDDPRVEFLQGTGR